MKIDWEKRKKSEEWAKEKACEFVKADLDLTFAEWCYQMGKSVERAKTIEEMSQIIRKIESDTSNCLFECPRADEPITCTICVLERAIKQMKGEQKND